MSRIVLLRHGESLWNKDGRFTGWTDIDLSMEGIKEASKAGHLLRAAGLTFDLVHTSYLKRAIRTMWIVLDELDEMWIPQKFSWRLNERHYGALQGLNKKVTAAEYGEEQVHKWRRSYNIRPPELALDDSRHPRFDPRYAGLSKEELPSTESLEDTLKRVMPYWHQSIVPEIEEGKTILVVAHGNSLRALVKYLDNISDQDIPDLNIPTGFPLVYELDQEHRPLTHYYLGDQSDIEEAATKVAGQSSIK